MLNSLLGGAFFPISVMPIWMRKIAFIRLITYSLDAMRLAVIQGHFILMLWKQLLILACVAVLLVPFGCYLLSRMIKRERYLGRLSHY